MNITFKRIPRGQQGRVGGGNTSPLLDPTTLKFIPYDDIDQANWLIPDKPIKVINGVSEFAGVASTGDIVALKQGATIFASQSQGGAGFLWELGDTLIDNPKAGDMLVFDGSNWLNVNKIEINCGTYNGF